MIHSFPTIYCGGVDVVEMGQIKVFVQELGLKQGFLADTNMDYLTSECPGTPNLKIDANFDMLITPMQKFSTGIQGVPTESWRPGLSENVVVFVAIIFWTGVMAAQSQQSLKF